MANYKEIVTKAVVGKGKKLFTTVDSVEANPAPTTILGCWVINHQFQGLKQQDKIILSGNYDVNIWYSYDNDTKTDVIKKTNSYQEIVNVRLKEDIQGKEEVIVRSLKQPNCTKIDISDNKITYTIEKELGIELVGDTKVKIAIDEEEEPWEDIIDTTTIEQLDQKIEEEVKENFIEETETN